MTLDDHPLSPPDPEVQAADGALLAASDDFGNQGFRAARDRVISDFERRYLTWLLNLAGGNMSRAARMAGVDRTTLYRLMGKHGLQRRTIMVGSD